MSVIVLLFYIEELHSWLYCIFSYISHTFLKETEISARQMTNKAPNYQIRVTMADSERCKQKPNWMQEKPLPLDQPVHDRKERNFKT